MKKVSKKSSINTSKKSVSKNAYNDILTRKIFKEELTKELKKELSVFVTKDDLKKELSVFVTKDDLKKELSVFVTKDDFHDEIKRIDKKFEDQTNTIMNAFESVNNILKRIEVGIEKDREENKVFKQGFIEHEKKIQNIDKRLTKVEIKVFK